MEDIQDKVIAPEEEKQQEEELLKETPVDELRQSVVEKFNLNEDIDSELIDKLVAETDSQRKTLSKAIKQKRTWREKAEAQTERKPEGKPQPSITPKVDDIANAIDQKLDERDLESLELSDEAKKKIKVYAKADNLTIKQVMKSDFFTFVKEKEESAKKVEEASIGGKRKAPTQRDFSKISPNDFDLSTEEGRKDYEEYKKIRKEKS